MRLFIGRSYSIVSLILSLLVMEARAQPICVTIKASPKNTINADILSYLPSRILSNPPYFLADDWTYGGTPGESRDLLRWDLSSIPTGAIINSAVLNLYADSTNQTGDYGSPMYGTGNASYLVQITSPWSVTTVDWSNQPSVTTINEILLSQSTSAIENYLNIDIRSFVQNWVNNPSQNYGMMLRMDSVSYLNSMTFCSGNYPDSTLWPTLVICYTPSSTNCVTIKGGPTNTINADVLSYLPTRINAACSYFLADDWTYSGTPGESRDLLQFDLSAIPTRVTIDSYFT